MNKLTLRKRWGIPKDPRMKITRLNRKCSIFLLPSTAV